MQTEAAVLEPGQETIALTKEDDRWKLVKPLKAEADFEKVNELLTKLSSLEARGENIIDKDDASHGFDQPGIAITIKWESETKDADGSKIKAVNARDRNFTKAKLRAATAPTALGPTSPSPRRTPWSIGPYVG